jgi:integrase/recombinase XerD
MPDESRLDRTSSPAFEAQKAAYLRHAKLKNFSPLTVRQLDQYLSIFIAFAYAQGVVEAARVDGALVERFKTHLMNWRTLKGEALRVNTVRERLLTVQRWFRFMKKKGLLAYNPAAEVAPPRLAKLLPRGVLRPDEVEKVMSQPDLRSPVGYRDRTMMELLYASGARAAELCSIDLADLDLARKTVKVLGKGGKQRLVPLTTPCCRFLRRYIDDVRPRLVEVLRPSGNNYAAKMGTCGDRLFVSIYGGPIRPGWLAALMKRYLFLAGVTRPLSPVHGFRHTVATHLLGDGMDARYIQVMLGHKSIDTTQIYAHVERDTMRRALAAYHPLDIKREPVKPFEEEKKNVHAA